MVDRISETKVLSGGGDASLELAICKGGTMDVTSYFESPCPQSWRSLDRVTTFMQRLESCMCRIYPQFLKSTLRTAVFATRREFLYSAYFRERFSAPDEFCWVDNPKQRRYCAEIAVDSAVDEQNLPCVTKGPRIHAP
jgi:hypothetical protein